MHEVSQTTLSGSASFGGGVAKDTGWLNSSYEEGLSQPYRKLWNRESPRSGPGAEPWNLHRSLTGYDCRSQANWLSDAHHPQRAHPWRGVSCRHPHSRRVEPSVLGEVRARWGGVGTKVSTPCAVCILLVHVVSSWSGSPQIPAMLFSQEKSSRGVLAGHTSPPSAAAGLQATLVIVSLHYFPFHSQLKGTLGEVTWSLIPVGSESLSPCLSQAVSAALVYLFTVNLGAREYQVMS